MKILASFWIFWITGVTIVTAHILNDTETYCMDSVFNSTELWYRATAKSVRHQTRAEFTCPLGQMLVGQKMMGCLKDGSLRKPRPVCVPFTCDFDSDMCGWSVEGSWDRDTDTVVPITDGDDSGTSPAKSTLDTTNKCNVFRLRSPQFPRDEENQAPLCFRFSYSINNNSNQDFVGVSMYIEEQANRSRAVRGRSPMFLESYCNLTGDIEFSKEEIVAVRGLMNETCGYQIVFEGSGNITLNSFMVDLCKENETFHSNTSLDNSCVSSCEEILPVEERENTTYLINWNTTTILPGNITGDSVDLDTENNRTDVQNNTIEGVRARFEIFEIPLHVWISAGFFALLLVLVVCVVCARIIRYRKMRRIQKHIDDFRYSTSQSYTGEGSVSDFWR